MKIIDLLNKIANNEELPKYIMFKQDVYVCVNNVYKSIEGYQDLFDFYCTELILNDELSIVDLVERN